MAKKNRKYSSARDRVKQAAAQAGPGGGGGTMFVNIPDDTEFYNPEKGRATLRILPYVVTDAKHPDSNLAPVDTLWYKRPFKRYKRIGVHKKPYISPLSIGKPCPVFEYFREAKADPNIPDKEADRAKPQDCVMYNVQVIDKNGKVSDPMFFWMSYHLFEKQLKKELDDPDNDEFLTFMDLEDGFDVKVRWEEESFEGNPFLCAGRISFVARDEDIDEDILDDLVNLDDCLVIKPYDELRNIFLEIDDVEEQPEPEPEPAAGGKAGGKKAKKSAAKPKTIDDDGELTVEELMDMSKKDMKKLAKKLDILDDLDDPNDEDELRAAIAGESDLDLPEPAQDDGLTVGELVEMSKKDMKRLVKKDKMDIKVAGMDEDELREAIADELDLTLPEEPDGDAGGGDEDNECPSGHTYGTDCDEKPECKDCDKWDDCMDRQEELDK